MKFLVRLVILLVVIIALLVARDAWESKKTEERRAQQRQEQAEKERREAIIAQRPAPTTGVVINNSPVNESIERRFRDLAQRHRVTITEFTSINTREAAVGMQAANHTAMPDLLDAARRAGLLRNFDDDMMARNNRSIPGQRGLQTRTTIQFH